MNKELLQKDLEALPLAEFPLRQEPMIYRSDMLTAIAQPVPPSDKPVPWHHRVLNSHPKSEPKFWSDELRLKYMLLELEEYRSNWAQPVPPAVSDPLTNADITSIAYDCNALPEVVTDATLAVFARAIESRTKVAK